MNDCIPPASRSFALAIVAATSVAVCVSGCNVAATARNLQGKRLYEQGQFSAALQNFQTAIERNPYNADAYYNMAATYALMGRQTRNGEWLAQADRLYRQALSLDAQHTEAYRGLAVLLIENGRATEAFDIMRGWRARSPQSAEPLIELARLHKEYGDRTQAVQYLADALTVDSDNARALKAMGQLREENGEYQLAMDNYIRSYRANSLQHDLAAKINALQTRLASQPTAPAAGQTRLGETWTYPSR